jgi:hypothetical protein
MIAYEELCDALARWRSKNGMAGNPVLRRASGRTSGQVAVPPPPPQPSAPPPLAAPPAEPPDLFAASTGDETSVSHSAVPEEQAPRENTSEIDLDQVDVVEEEN